MNQEIYSYFVDLIHAYLTHFADFGKMDMHKATAYFSRETEHKIAIMMARVLILLVENDLIKNPLQDD